MRSHTIRLTRTALVLAAASLAAACGATTGTTAAVATSASAYRASGHESARDRLLVVDGSAPHAVTALELVRRLRPEYLRNDATPRIPSSAPGVGAPVVYVDGTQWGGIEALAGIPAAWVAEIRHVPTVEARTRYGLVARGPVIDVRLHRRR